MYARYGFMELRIKEAVWRFESVYASIFDKSQVRLVLDSVLGRTMILE